MGEMGCHNAYFLVVPEERLFQIFMGHTGSESEEFRDQLFTAVFEGVR